VATTAAGRPDGGRARRRAGSPWESRHGSAARERTIGKEELPDAGLM
jgi:hypothetical protein